MKNIKFLTLLLFLIPSILLVESCKDPCEGVVCQNGGNCEEGICINCSNAYRGVNCELLNKALSTQELLDLGVSPKILMSNGIAKAELFAKIYTGGYIVYVNEDGRGMLAAQTDATSALNWIDARDYCEALTMGGVSDWLLPGQGDLDNMWQKLADADRDGINTGPQDAGNYGGFTTDSYWSSELHKALPVAWYQNFDDGGIYINDMNDLRRVRAVRFFE